MKPFRYRQVIAIAAGLAVARLLVFEILAPIKLSDALCQWDCGWYLSIIGQGYDAAPHLVDGWSQANWAFFPLYPLLVRYLDALTGIDPKPMGMLLSTACFVAFAALGARYRQITRGEASPWTWLLFVFAWPFGFYFHALYTESLYAALATAALLALARDKPLAAGITTAFLGATRPTGMLLAAWIGLDGLWKARSAGSLAEAMRLLLPAAIAPLGLVAFMVFLYFRAGDPLAFQHIQAGWQRTGGNPLTVLADALGKFDPAKPRLGPFYLVGWAVAGLAASVWLLVRRRFAEAWFCGLSVLMALSSGSVFSIPRYVSASPVFLFVVGDIVGSIRRPRLRYGLLLGMAVLQVALALFWFRGAAFLG